MQVPIEESLSTADGLHYGCERNYGNQSRCQRMWQDWCGEVEMAAIYGTAVTGTIVSNHLG